MKFFKNFNIFTFLMIVAVFAFVFRLVNITAFPTLSSVAQTTPVTQKFAPVSEQPPAPPPAEALPPASDAAAPPTTDEPAPAAAEQVPPPIASPYGEQSFSAAEIGVLQSLAKRRDELDKREQEMGRREALLKAAGGEVDRKIAELNKIRGELEDLLNKQKVAQDERINSLVKIYENMKPKEAARIFDTLEMDVLLSVVGKMSERKTSPILASMDPEKARQVTIKLAEQRNLPHLPEDVNKDTPVPVPAPVAPLPQPVAAPAGK